MKHYKKLLCLITIGILFYSCQNDDNEITPQNTAEEQNYLNIENEDGVIKLGEKLENPYAVENMKQALENLKKSNKSAKSLTDEIEITTTHLYVKFIPKTEDELDILKRDSTLVLYGYPLDYEIEEGGYFYRDPAVPQNQPTYQYAAIKVDKELPNEVENEILEELFIPDEDSDLENKTSSKSESVTYQMVDALVDEALRITNNLDVTLQNKSSKTTRSKWRPAGTIKVWDDNFSSSGSYVGVQGVQVRARRWFTTHRGIADSDGDYSCDGRFRRDANYSIDWERYQFALQDGWLNGATYNGPKKRGDWDLNLNSGKQEYYATIFRAAYHYYYKDIRGLRRPPQNSFWRTQLKIRAYLENVSDDGALGTHKEERRFLGAQVKIYTYQREAESTYSTVIHELAHASHWNMNRSNFDDSGSRIKESWAAGVEWSLSRQVYPNYSRGYNNRYTGVVVDMIDPIGGTDQVTGYTIRQIEDALNGQTSWISWRNNIINTIENDTEENLDALFDRWDF